MSVTVTQMAQVREFIGLDTDLTSDATVNAVYDQVRAEVVDLFPAKTSIEIDAEATRRTIQRILRQRLADKVAGPGSEAFPGGYSYSEGSNPDTLAKEIAGAGVSFGGGSGRMTRGGASHPSR